MNNNYRSPSHRQQPPIFYRNTVSKLPSQLKISFLRKSSSQQKLPPFLIPQLIRQNSILNHKCTLCEEFYGKSQLESISNCQHVFCTPCLHRYCIYKIDVMEDVTCPQEGCTMQLQPNTKVFEDLPPNTKNKYRRNILWKQTISNPNLKLCPKENCQGVIDKSQPVYECNRCKTKYCKECELVAHSGLCDTNFQDNFKDWKRCPQCKMFIERTEGCNHMTCRCGHQFCFVCLADWQDSHYECGTGNFNNQIYELPCWKRFLFGLLIVICFPVLLAIYVAFWALSLVLGAICGFFGGPVFFYTQLYCLQNSLFTLFCPLYMALGAVIGVLGAFGFGIYILGLGTGATLLTLKALWCNCQQQHIDDEQLQL